MTRARFIRLTQNEPYRMVGTNTAGAPVVTQTLRVPRKPRSITRRVAAR